VQPPSAKHHATRRCTHRIANCSRSATTMVGTAEFLVAEVVKHRSSSGTPFHPASAIHRNPGSLARTVGAKKFKHYRRQRVSSPERQRCGAGGQSVAGKVLNFFAPTVLANEPGLRWIALAGWNGVPLLLRCSRLLLREIRLYRPLVVADLEQLAMRMRATPGVAWCFADGGCTCIPPFAWLQPADDRATRVKQVQT